MREQYSRETAQAVAGICKPEDAGEIAAAAASPKVLPYRDLSDNLREDASCCDSSRSGTRTRTSLTGQRILSHDDTPENPEKTGVSANAGADAGAVETKREQFSPELQALIDAWPALPEALKAGILAMVRAAGGNP